MKNEQPIVLKNKDKEVILRFENRDEVREFHKHSSILRTPGHFFEIRGGFYLPSQVLSTGRLDRA